MAKATSTPASSAQAKAREIQRLMGEGQTASQVITKHPDLVAGLDLLVTAVATRDGRPRGSGAVEAELTLDSFRRGL